MILKRKINKNPFNWKQNPNALKELNALHKQGLTSKQIFELMKKKYSDIKTINQVRVTLSAIIKKNKVKEHLKEKPRGQGKKFIEEYGFGGGFKELIKRFNAGKISADLVLKRRNKVIENFVDQVIQKNKELKLDKQKLIKIAYQAALNKIKSLTGKESNPYKLLKDGIKWAVHAEIRRIKQPLIDKRKKMKLEAKNKRKNQIKKELQEIINEINWFIEVDKLGRRQLTKEMILILNRWTKANSLREVKTLENIGKKLNKTKEGVRLKENKALEIISSYKGGKALVEKLKKFRRIKRGRNIMI